MLKSPVRPTEPAPAPAEGGADVSLRVPMTVERALGLPAVQQGDPIVCSGRDSLGREIRWAHSAELPNIARLLIGGELLLTTCIALGRREHEQRAFIRELADKGIAGLVVELGAAFSELPEPLADESERRELPLIALRKEVPFVQVTEAIHREILNRQYLHLERGTEIHDRLNELVLAGGGVSEVVEALAQAIKNPVLLENEHHELLAHADINPCDVRALAAWRAWGGETWASSGGEAVLPVPDGGRSSHGRLIALSLDHPISELDRVILQRAVWLIALTLQRAHQEEELSLRSRGNFLLDVAEGRLSPESAVAAAHSFGFDAHELMIPAVVRVTGGQSAVPSGRWMDIARNLSAELRTRRIPQVVGVRPAENEILMVAGAASADRRVHIADQIATTSRLVIGRRLPAVEVIVAIGAASTWESMSTALREATEAAAAGGAMERQDWHDATVPDIERFLWLQRDQPALQSFVRRCLGPLLEHDCTHKHQLFPTLEALCKRGGNKTLTAQDLFLARQALYNRLRRISDVLGADITEPATFAAVSVAVKAARYIDPL